MKPLVLAALSLGTLLLFTPVIAQQSTTQEPRQHGQTAMPQTSGMMDHDKWMAEMKASDAQLQMLADRMKSARGAEKVVAMEDVVSQLVTNELRMHEHVRMMMQTGTMPGTMPKK